MSELTLLLPYLRRFHNILLYNFISGLVLSFTVIFINKVILKSLPLDTPQSTLNFKVGVVFLFQGAGSIAMGLRQSRLPFYYNSKPRDNLFYGLVALEAALFLLALSYNLFQHSGTHEWVCWVVMLAGAAADIHVKTSQDAYVKAYLRGGAECTYKLLQITAWGSWCTVWAPS